MPRKDPTQIHNTTTPKDNHNNHEHEHEHEHEHDHDHDHDEPNQFLIFMGLNVVICIVGYIFYIMKTKWS